jgi:DNA invertase Pin-like site-specific DNA recombinase
VIAAYLRVSTQEQGESGLGLLAQRRTILAEVERRGWPEPTWHEEVTGNGKPGPVRSRALESLVPSDALIVARLDRLGRSLKDFADLMERSRNEGWSLVVLDAPVDTSTPAGAAMAQVMAVFAELERRLIGERTKAALAEAQRRGVRLGAKPTVPDPVRKLISEHRAAGKSFGEIAANLTEAKVPTASGREVWSKSSVLSVVKSVRYRGVKS